MPCSSREELTMGSFAVVGCCNFKLEVEALIANQIISYFRLYKNKRLKVILAVRFAEETLGTGDLTCLISFSFSRYLGQHRKVTVSPVFKTLPWILWDQTVNHLFCKHRGEAVVLQTFGFVVFNQPCFVN